MAAMASFFDVVYLQDSLCLSCKDVTKQRRLRYSMLSVLLAMVEMFRALHSVWITLLPFALLWWDVMLHAMCANYCAWNRSWLWLQQAAGHSICADVVQELCAPSEASLAEQREMCPNSSHQRGSSDVARHVPGITEMSIVSLRRPGACVEADAHAEKKDACSLSLHPGRKSPQGFGVSFPHPRMLDALSEAGDVIALCLEELCPRRLEQQIPGCEAETVSALSQTSKLSSICFLQERGPQMSWSVKDCHWAVCASLLRPLVMGDICPLPSISIPLDLSCLQINLDRNRDLLHLDQYKGSVCIDHVSIKWSILRNWLQILNGRCVPDVIQGKNVPNLEWGVTEVSTSRPINVDNHIIPSYGTTENVNLGIAAQRSLLDLPGFQVRKGNIYAKNGDSGLDNSEDTGSASDSSIKSDDECEGAYCTSTEFTTDSNDRLDYSDVLYGVQGYRDDDCCYHKCLSVDDTENIYEGFVCPATDIDDSFYDRWAGCNVGYVGPLCGADVDGICSMDYYTNESGYANCGSNIDVSDAPMYGDVLHIYEYGGYESPLKIHAGDSHTWWDEDAVLLDVKETEEEKIEEEWQVL